LQSSYNQQDLSASSTENVIFQKIDFLRSS
jgi:hypothetical protein